MIFDNSLVKQKFINYLADLTQKKSLRLAIIQIGNDFASTKYVGIKKKVGEKLNIQVDLHKFDLEATFSEVESLLIKIYPSSDGLIFQLPLPDLFQKLVEELPVSKDVDLLSNRSFELVKNGFLPPTIGAIDLVLKEILLNNLEKNNHESNDFDSSWIDLKLDFSGKNVAIVGQGKLVGTPLCSYFLQRNATILSLNKFSQNPKDLVSKADIVIGAAGSADLIDKTWLNPKAIIIDAATSESDNKQVGDVDKNNIHTSNLLCPSPGGIGAITVLYLFYNLYKLSLKV